MNTLLSAHARAEIDRWITRYPKNEKRSGVLQALTIVQEENGGFLTEALMDAVADYLGMAKISVYEVATFYTMYGPETGQWAACYSCLHEYFLHVKWISKKL